MAVAPAACALVFLLSPAFLPTALWAAEMPWAWVRSPTGDAAARSVAVDTAGDIYLVGSFSGEMTIDECTLVSSGTSDIFVLKFDLAGQLLWGKSFGAAWLEYGYEVAVDFDDNLYVAGQFSTNSLTIGSFVLVNSYQAGHIQWSTFDVVVFKLDREGEVVWAASGGGIGNEAVGGLGVDTAADALVLGTFFSPAVSFAPHQLVNTGNADLFVVKYDSGGSPVWARSAAGAGQENAWDLATDSADQIYIGGSFRSPTLTFDQVSLPNTSDSFDLYLAKLSPDGATIWAKTAAGEAWDDLEALAVDVDDGIFIAGHFGSDSLRFDPEVIYLSASGGTNIDMFVAKLRPAGTIEWITSSNGGAWLYPNAACAYEAQDIAIVGSFNGLSGGHPENLGATTIVPIDSYDVFAVQYDASGDVLWSEAVGEEHMEFGQDVACDAQGNLYLTGWTDSDSLRIGSWLLINDYSNKSFLGKKTRSPTAIADALDVGPGVVAFTTAPNPAAGEVRIMYAAEGGEVAALRIYDVAGRLVRRFSPASHAGAPNGIAWDIRDLEGSKVPAGVYFVCLRVGPSVVSRKVVVVD